jgi:hypothetical protein
MRSSFARSTDWSKPGSRHSLLDTYDEDVLGRVYLLLDMCLNVDPLVARIVQRYKPKPSASVHPPSQNSNTLTV